MGRRRINRGRQRREEIEAQVAVMKEERAERTAEQQLALLDERLGEGVGATKERARLQHLIENPPRPKKGKK